ncbi:maltokinase N-terminal cap-like domain-containing protein [Streptomyces sp. 8N706]|uniref:maltokinase N-terminal cap-like domain-containing protein n=1 Tax=Streptomyces sp. 8N706 TaxID=3457416 RepID=UPI003FD2007A
MAVIHKTTMTPGKLELLASWLPTQPWYISAGSEPELSKAGGFRLEDPEGEVGIEFMVVTDESGDRPVSYHVPVSYRGAPLGGADEALIGTAEHGVLGRRWVYDGTHDPVVVAQLLALLQGRAEPQAQNVTDTPDPSVTISVAGDGLATELRPTTVANGSYGTRLGVETGAEAGPNSVSAGRLTVHVTRVLQPEQEAPSPRTTEAQGYVTAGWLSPDGGENRGLFAVLRRAAS